jgi:hypothetical protein
MGQLHDDDDNGATGGGSRLSLPVIAYFTEHMLVMGRGLYPVENESISTFTRGCATGGWNLCP